MLVVLTLANVVYKPQLVLAAARALSRRDGSSSAARSLDATAAIQGWTSDLPKASGDAPMAEPQDELFAPGAAAVSSSAVAPIPKATTTPSAATRASDKCSTSRPTTPPIASRKLSLAVGRFASSNVIPSNVAEPHITRGRGTRSSGTSSAMNVFTSAPNS